MCVHICPPDKKNLELPDINYFKLTRGHSMTVSVVAEAGKVLRAFD